MTFDLDVFDLERRDVCLCGKDIRLEPMLGTYAWVHVETDSWFCHIDIEWEMHKAYPAHEVVPIFMKPGELARLRREREENEKP